MANPVSIINFHGNKLCGICRSCLKMKFVQFFIWIIVWMFIVYFNVHKNSYLIVHLSDQLQLYLSYNWSNRCTLVVWPSTFRSSVIHIFIWIKKFLYDYNWSLYVHINIHINNNHKILHLNVQRNVCIKVHMNSCIIDKYIHMNIEIFI